MIKKRILPTEHQEQVALIQWAAITKFRPLPDKEAFIKDYICASANGEMRPLVIGGANRKFSLVGKKLKDAGVMKGFPDLFLFVPKKQYAGLFIEMKSLSTGAYIQPSQLICLNRLNRQGYLAVVCKGYDEAKKVIEEYLFEEGSEFAISLIERVKKMLRF